MGLINLLLNFSLGILKLDITEIFENKIICIMKNETHILGISLVSVTP